MGDVGGGFGQKFFMQREEAAVVAGRVPASGGRSSGSRTAARTCRGDARARRRRDRHARARRRRPHPRRAPRPPRGRRRVPGRRDRRHRAVRRPCCSPGPYRIPKMGSAVPRRCGRTRAGRGAYRGPWMFETVAREQIMDRRGARPSGIDPLELRRRNVVPHRRAAVHHRRRACRSTRSRPTETLEQAAAIIDYDAFRAEQARAFDAEGRLLGIGIGLYVEPTSIAMGSLGIEAATVRVEPERDGHGVRWAPARTARASRRRSRRSSPSTSASTIDDVVVVQGDTDVDAVRRRDRRQPHRGHRRQRGARRVRCRCATRRSRSPPTCSRPRPRTSSSSTARCRCAARRRATSPLAEVAARRLQRRAGAAAGDRRRGSRRRRATRRRPITWSNACHVCTVEVDRAHRAGQDPALRRQRGLRRDDQPDGRRGPDRRRRRAGHRRRALRALRLRRRRQPADHDVHRLPAADRDRGADDRVRPHRDASRRLAGRAQGHGRGRRHRLAARGRQRGRRRARAARREGDRAAAHPFAACSP